jgi:acyl-CoA thioester hydrolase
MQYVTTHQVRFSDVDRFGHLNHVRLLEFFETARNPYFRHLAEVEQRPCVLDTAGFVIADLSVQFRHAVPAGTPEVEVRASVDRVGRSSITLRYELWNDDTLFVEATTVLVFVANGRSDPIDGTRRKFLCRYASDSTRVDADDRSALTAS